MDVLLLTAGETAPPQASSPPTPAPASAAAAAAAAPAEPAPRTGSPAAAPLPIAALALLPLTISRGDLAAPLQSVLGYESRLHQAPALILIDGTGDLIAARAAALALSGRTPLPRVALVADSALTALTREWRLADFLTPAASPAEIDARLRLALAGAAVEGAGQGSQVAVSGIEIDESNFVATAHGRTLDLTYKEFELLHFLAAHPARVFTREQLLAEVWGHDYFGGARTVDVHVRRLRAKLGEHEWLISTVRGVGYGFARGRQAEHAPPTH